MRYALDRLVPEFQSTLSVRRATIQLWFPPADMVFQSTLSVRRATKVYKDFIDKTLFQSTLSVRRATADTSHYHLSFTISIHALRKESDLFFC